MGWIAVVSRAGTACGGDTGSSPSTKLQCHVRTQQKVREDNSVGGHGEVDIGVVDTTTASFTWGDRSKECGAGLETQQSIARTKATARDIAGTRPQQEILQDRDRSKRRCGSKDHSTRCCKDMDRSKK